MYLPRIALLAFALSFALSGNASAQAAGGDIGLKLTLGENGELLAEIDEEAEARLYLFALHPASSLRRTNRAQVLRFDAGQNRLEVRSPKVVTQGGQTISVDGIVSDAAGGRTATEGVRLVAAKMPNGRGAGEGDVYDVSELVLGDARAAGVLWERNVDRSRSSIESVSRLGETYVIQARLTFAGTAETTYSPTTLTATWSLRQLPDKQMPARLHHPEMAYFAAPFVAPTNTPEAMIRRYRLIADGEGQGNSANRGIEFYLDPRTPDWAVPAVESAVQQWNVAFEAAGFADALMLLRAPADVEWEVFAAAHSVIWIEDVSGILLEQPGTEDLKLRRPAAGPLASGGGTVYHLVDPRSGEILQSRVHIGLPFGLGVDFFFPRCSVLDERAHQLPFPIDLQREILTVLIAHEIGHALGLRDGDYGESSASAAQLRDNDWLSENAPTAIMNYGRCNPVPQPEDNVEIRFLFPRISPAETYQIILGYADAVVVDRARTAFREKYGDLRIFYGHTHGPQSHDYTSEASDPVQATLLSLNNLQRTTKILNDMPIRTMASDRYRLYLYTLVVEYWRQLFEHVGTLVGGELVYFDTQGKRVRNGIESSRQQIAAQFIADHAFTGHDWLFGAALASVGTMSERRDIVASEVMKLVDELVHRSTLRPLVAQCDAYDSDCFGADDYLRVLRTALFEDVRRFNDVTSLAQVEFVKSLIALRDAPFQGRPGRSDYILAGFADMELQSLKAQFSGRPNRRAAPLAQRHVEYMRQLIDARSE